MMYLSGLFVLGILVTLLVVIAGIEWGANGVLGAAFAVYAVYLGTRS